MKIGDLVKVWDSKSTYVRTEYQIGTIVGEEEYMEPDDEDRLRQYYWPVLVDGEVSEINDRKLEILR